MADYIYLDSYSKKGKLGISYHVFDQIVTSAIDKIKGVSKAENKLKRTQSSRLNRPVQTRIHKNIVTVWIYIDIVKGKNVQEVVKEIQNEVYDSLLMLAEQVPVNVQIKVESII